MDGWYEEVCTVLAVVRKRLQTCCIKIATEKLHSCYNAIQKQVKTLKL